MARGRSRRAGAATSLTPAPPRLVLPDDRDRVATSGTWEDYLHADRPSTEIVRLLNAAWRLPEAVQVGVYSNGREQGVRLTRPAAGDDPGLTFWFAEYRTSDDIMLYQLARECYERNFWDLPETVWTEVDEGARRFRYGEEAQVVAALVEALDGRPLSAFSPIPGRPTDLRDAFARSRA